MDGNGRVKITDFGLARIYDFNMRLTTMVSWVEVDENELGFDFNEEKGKGVGCIMVDCSKKVVVMSVCVCVLVCVRIGNGGVFWCGTGGDVVVSCP